MNNISEKHNTGIHMTTFIQNSDNPVLLERRNNLFACSLKVEVLNELEKTFRFHSIQLMLQ